MAAREYILKDEFLGRKNIYFAFLLSTSNDNVVFSSATMSRGVCLHAFGPTWATTSLVYERDQNSKARVCTIKRGPFARKGASSVPESERRRSFYRTSRR